MSVYVYFSCMGVCMNVCMAVCVDVCMNVCKDECMDVSSKQRPCWKRDIRNSSFNDDLLVVARDTSEHWRIKTNYKSQNI